MSELCKTLEYEFLDPPNASVVQQAQCRTGLPLSPIQLLSWFNSLHSSLIHQFESQPHHCSASRLCCCAASSPFKSFPVRGKRLCPFGEDVFLAMSLHTASQKYSVDRRHVSFPASSPSLSPLQGLQPWQFPQKTGSKEEALLTPLYGELHLHTFPRICWQSSERRKVRVVVDRPCLCRASSVDAKFEGLKNSNTPADREGHLFQFWCSVPRTLKLKKAPLHYFRRPCHHLKVALPWFSSALRFSIVMSCNLQAEANVTGRGRAAAWSISKEVFFGIFGKSYARGRRETKKIITVALF